MKSMWNQRYAAQEYVYGTEPNGFFRQELDKLEPGRILLPAEGEGRNAVYAAGCGWDVQAFDHSEEGRRKALRLASERKVTILYDLCDIESADYPEASFDVVALIFVHLPSEKRKAVLRRLTKFLKPGGTLILEGFSKEQLQFASGGPKDEDMLFSVAELEDDFADLMIMEISRHLLTIDEGSHHRGDASVVRLVARKQ
jgi:2-polyprenyl-3-methyl-5-hydroxy-6-metoxy-1,4-benzoquinol methylase